MLRSLVCADGLGFDKPYRMALGNSSKGNRREPIKSSVMHFT